MPIHDWTRVGPGTFHAFHYQWLAAIANRLNAGTLPPDFYALPEQYVNGPQGDVVTLQLGLPPGGATGAGRGATVVMEKPTARFVLPAGPEWYARKTNHLAIRNEFGRVVAVIEIVSPGNKSSRRALDAFAAKVGDLLTAGVNLLVIDVLPPNNLHPRGMHPVVWDEDGREFDPPADEPLTAAAYQGSPLWTAYVEPTAVGRPVPPMPLFLDGDWHVMVPLDDSYQTAWAVQPRVMQTAVAGVREA